MWVRRSCGAAGLGLTLFVLTGCQGALVGDWHMVEAAQPRQVFTIDHASFRNDGSYTATTIVEGVTHNDTGTYEFTGFKLRLRPQGGGQRTYTAALGPRRLNLADGKRRVVLERGAR